MFKRPQVFVAVSPEQKELVRELSFKLRMSESDLMKATALPALYKLRDVVDDPDEAKKVKELLTKRIKGGLNK